MRLSFFAAILLIFTLGCSTSEVQQQPRTYPHPASYAVDGFYLDKEPPVHEREPIPGPFYFRDCSRATQGSYFSKTAFSCADH
ncbi:MAG: hypothetical protein A4S09_07650 [Proteobacteria bacterium SG_bin7]|nr:MAG: hypothetical protein A4S09_07650 [Proteobacteria bacterium SG_bin7]